MVVALAELGRQLQHEHGRAWLRRSKGDDPYAGLLCGVDDDPSLCYRQIRERGALWRSELGTWVAAAPDVAGELLRHPQVRHVLPVPGQSVVPDLDLDLDHDAIERACVRVVDRVGTEFDVVGDIAEAVPAEILADRHELGSRGRVSLAHGIAAVLPALDAILCPQRLDTTLLLRSGMDELRATLPDLTATGIGTVVVAARVCSDLVAHVVDGLLIGTAPAHVPADAEATRLVRQTLVQRPPVRLLPMVATAELHTAGATIAAGDQVVALVADAGVGFGVLHQALEPFHVAVAEAVLKAMRVRFGEVWRTGPALHRRRAPVTQGTLRIPVRARPRRNE